MIVPALVLPVKSASASFLHWKALMLTFEDACRNLLEQLKACSTVLQLWQSGWRDTVA